MSVPSPRPHHPLNNGHVLLIAGLIFHAIMLFSLSRGYLNPLYDDAMHRSGRGVDFFAVYQAGQNVLDGTNIYSTEPVRQVVPFYTPYRYHPFVAFTVGLLSRSLPPYTAYGIWIMVLEGLLLANIIVTRRLFSRETDANRATALWLLFTPFYLELYMGQFSFLMATLLFWTVVAWARQETRKGEWLWTASLLVKSNSILFVPVMIRERMWKPLIRGGCVALALAAPYFVFMPGSLRGFARNVTEAPAVQTLFGNQGFTALIGISVLRVRGLWSGYVQEFVTRLEAMNAALLLPVILWSSVVLVTTVVLTIKARSGRTTELLILWILAYFLFYKHVWEHQYVMMMPLFVLIYWRVKTGNLVLSLPIFWTLFAVIALPTVFILVDRSPVLFDPELSWNFWESFIVHAPKPFAVLILYCSLSLAVLRNPPERTPALP